MKTLPKSLHTVTAWVNCAQYFMRMHGHDAKAAALRAECMLGLETMADYHGIKTAVINQLMKGKK
jgi:hypothetical protein